MLFCRCCRQLSHAPWCTPFRRIRGLPWWYQLLAGIAAGLAEAGLWLTYFTDPGALLPAASPGQLLDLLLVHSTTGIKGPSFLI
jgi:hypothetical protein